jgi:hypothetical protein
MSVRQEVMRKHEDEFLHLYYDTLIQAGAVKTDDFPFSACFQKYFVGIATTAAVPILTARGVIEGRKFINKPPSNPALADHAKVQITMHDSIFRCSSFPFLSLPLSFFFVIYIYLLLLSFFFFSDLPLSSLCAECDRRTKIHNKAPKSHKSIH